MHSDIFSMLLSNASVLALFAQREASLGAGSKAWLSRKSRKEERSEADLRKHSEELFSEKVELKKHGESLFSVILKYLLHSFEPTVDEQLQCLLMFEE